MKLRVLLTLAFLLTCSVAFAKTVNLDAKDIDYELMGVKFTISELWTPQVVSETKVILFKREKKLPFMTLQVAVGKQRVADFLRATKDQETIIKFEQANSRRKYKRELQGFKFFDSRVSNINYKLYIFQSLGEDVDVESATAIAWSDDKTKFFIAQLHDNSNQVDPAVIGQFVKMTEGAAKYIK